MEKEEEENLTDLSRRRKRDTAICSVVSKAPESHLALFLLTTPPVASTPAERLQIGLSGEARATPRPRRLCFQTS